MNEELLTAFQAYTRTDESLAVLFVKKHLADAKGNWIEVHDFRRYEMSSDKLHFRFVEGSLFRQKMRPEYPTQSSFTSAGNQSRAAYTQAARAITWQTAQTDIAAQKAASVRGRRFKITGVSYDSNRNCKNFFRDDAPPMIKALEENLNDRTNPLWEVALSYAVKPNFVYRIKSVYLDP